MAAPREIVDALDSTLGIFFSGIRHRERATFLLCDELVEIGPANCEPGTVPTLTAVTTACPASKDQCTQPVFASSAYTIPLSLPTNTRPPATVALLTPGSIRDGGWNQGAYEGLVRIRDELDAEVAHQETRTPQEFEAGFRDFAARGFGLVFGHGFEFQDAAAIVSGARSERAARPLRPWHVPRRDPADDSIARSALEV